MLFTLAESVKGCHQQPLERFHYSKSLIIPTLSGLYLPILFIYILAIHCPKCTLYPGRHSLLEVLHCDRKLFLVFEYLDYDLKKFMDHNAPSGIPHEHVKVRTVVYSSVQLRRMDSHWRSLKSVRKCMNIQALMCDTTMRLQTWVSSPLAGG